MTLRDQIDHLEATIGELRRPHRMYMNGQISKEELAERYIAYCEESNEYLANRAVYRLWERVMKNTQYVVKGVYDCKQRSRINWALRKLSLEAHRLIGIGEQK